MKLSELAALIPNAVGIGDMELEVTGISMHSKQVASGDLFVCIPGIPGFQEDRHRYAGDAVQAGAVALVVERDVECGGVPMIKVPDARYALARMAVHLNGYPSSKLKLIGVTGTNGKTTTAHMIEAILAHAGYQTGLMGNLGTKIGKTMQESDLNTQEPPSLQANLKRMADEAVEYAVMEVSSQGLSVGRVIGCDYRTAVFTNLTQDHLDFHGSMEAYLAAKGLLYARLGNAFSPDPTQRKFAVLNGDEEASAYLRQVTAAQVLTYGIHHEQADVRAANIRLTSRGTSFDVVSYAGKLPFEMRMVGTFNVYNALAAIACALAEQIPLAAIQEGLAQFGGVPGRMEVIDEGQEYLVLVDYAHTPDGLENVLSTVRTFAERRVITVFGCGGDRDRTKRPIMGKLSATYSDYVIVTSDNPRSEEPDRILADIAVGLEESGWSRERYMLLADRAQAIAEAIRIAEPGDVVIIAGKGHETYQIIGGETKHFDDREEARGAIHGR
jgi:UDP-N-acetylmuramoyl-L-alanyl-D-glutamate--2,6-diaminopimelate ligase